MMEKKVYLMNGRKMKVVSNDDYLRIDVSSVNPIYIKYDLNST